MHMWWGWSENRGRGERACFRAYAELCKLEPRLVPLLIETMELQPHTWDFMRHLKPRLTKLVGHSVDHPVLGTSDAYDTVYEVLYSLCYDASDQDTSTTKYGSPHEPVV